MIYIELSTHSHWVGHLFWLCQEWAKLHNLQMTILSISTLYLNVSATITWCIRKSTSKWTSVWQRTRGGKIKKKWKSQNLLSLRTEIADFIMKQFFSDIIEYLGECSVLARELCAAIAVASQLYNFQSIIELKHCTHNEWNTVHNSAYSFVARVCVSVFA